MGETCMRIRRGAAAARIGCLFPIPDARLDYKITGPGDVSLLDVGRVVRLEHP